MPDEYRIGRLKGRYVVTWWVDGKRSRHRLDAQSRKEAEGEAIDVIRAQTVKAEPNTIRLLWELYRKEKDGRRIAAAMEFEGRYLLPELGHLRPDQLTVDLTRAYVAKRRQTGMRGKTQDGTIWTELGHLRTVFIWAKRKGIISLAPDVERPEKPAPKDRWLTREEAELLIASAPAPHIKLAIMLMLSTAGRVGAILELQWDRVDFANNSINLRTTETGPRKGRAIVPMNAGIRAALAAARQATLSDYVIEWAGGPVARIRTGFTAAVKASGLKGVTPHVLRHTAAVHLVAGGTRMDKVSQYLGHTSTAITEKIYARFAPDHLQDEANILDFSTIRRVK